ncbi:phage tail protein [Campylobacter jejuni]
MGVTIEYAVDLSTNGGAYQQVLVTKVSDKTSAKYERSHRIDLPRGNTWNIRVRRITPNATSDLISDKMYVDAITEIIDAKLRYPNTAMLGLQYNAAAFSNVAKLSVRCKGKIISVPSNYDPVSRTYTGVWNGTFKQAYSNNPAWVYYDICTQWRYGLGNRLTAAMIDKWSLYALAQYCDEKVSDGKGGQEPRFTVNVYLQAQQDAFTVLQSLAAIFRAMSYWQGEQIVLDADLPKDPVYTFSRANVIDGEFSYTGTRARDRHTIAKVAWDNPEQKFKTEYEFVRDEAAIAKYGVKVLDLSIVGCTSQGQAQRAGLWALKSEQLETRTVTFKTGLDGFIPTVGSIINVSDEVLAGRANGGRVAAVSANLSTITLDRDVTVNVGDTLIVNADNGKAQRRIVSAVNGRNVTVSVAFSGISSQNVWAVDSSDLKTMRFRVLSIKQDDVTFTITALQHEPQKYDAIDYGAIVHDTTGGIRPAPIPQSIAAPSFVTLSQRNRTEQTQNITTLIIAWGQVSGAIAYNVEWRKDDGDWQNVYNVNKNSVEVDGVYAGDYVARVRAISAYGAISEPTSSNVVTITGKTQKPSKNLQLTAVGILFGMRLRWVYPANSTDTNYTEIQMATEPDTNVSDLGKFAYPTDTHTMQGLAGNLTLFFRARLVDKVGNVGDWTDWVEGTTSADAKAVLDLLNGQIKESQLYQDLGAKIGKISTIETGLSQEIQDRIAAQAQEASDRQAAIDAEIQNRTAAIKVNADAIAAERDARIADIKTNADAINQEIQNRAAAVKINTDAIAAERDARIADIKTNSDAISQETQNRIAAVKSVSDGLTQELKDRADGDNAVLEVITNYKTSNDNALAAVQSDIKTVTTAQSATASKLDGVYAIVTPLTADSNQWTADSGNKTATAWTLQSAIATGDYTLAQRIDTLDANFLNNSAAITTERLARADADKAIAQRVDNYIAQTDSSIATVKNDIKTTADATSANSSALTALDNRVTTIDANTNTAMQNAASAVSKAETAVNQAGSASSLAQTASATATNAQSVANTAKSTADTAKSTADTANTNAATAVNKANAAADSASATASSLQEVKADLAGKASAGAVTQIDSKVTELGGKVNANTTKIDGVYAIVTPLTADSVLWTADSGTKAATAWTLQSAIVDGDSALSQRIDALNASFNSNNAAIITEQMARVNADSALSSRIDTYVAQTDSSIATIKQDVKTTATATTANSNAITALDNRVTTIDTNTNTAMQNAASAVSKAETAVNQAGSASSLAQTASATATNAKSVADAAKSTADTAKSTADTANTNAATAVNKANAAADSASATASTLKQVQADLAGKASTGSVTAVDSRVSELSGKVTANTTKLDGVYAIVTPLTADSVLWTADSGTKTATAWTLQSAYATADMALSQKIDNVSSTYNDSLASVQRETKTVSDKYSALATDVNIIKAAQGGNLSLVMDNYYTKANTDQTIAQKISTFKSEVVDPALNKKADAGALQETTAKVDKIDGQLQAASTKLDGVYAKVSPLTADSDNWRADSGAKAATSWTLQSAIADSERVVSKRVDALSSQIDNDIASIRTTQQALTNTSLSQAVEIKSLGASFANADTRLGTNEAAIRTEEQARANGDKALAQQITTLSTTTSELVEATEEHDEYIKQNTATIQQQQQTINGLFARWSIKVDINGRISGIGFAASRDTSDFAIRADKFYIAPPDGEGKGDTPFIVLSTAQQVGDVIVPAGTYIKSAYIHEASIDTLKIRSQAVSVVASVSGFPNGTLSNTQTIYIDSQGGSIKVDFNMVGFDGNGTGYVNFYVNGSTVMYYAYNVTREIPTVSLPIIVSGGYGMTAISVGITGNNNVKQYVLTATALKR